MRENKRKWNPKAKAAAAEDVACWTEFHRNSLMSKKE
jgi:hypothetical protein